MCVLRNTEARSRDIFCYGKAIYITYFYVCECAFVGWRVSMRACVLRRERVRARV